jgi:predicted protein tyrosine phosphatase
VKHVLFVCGKNLRRSPTAEQVFASWPGVEVASAGLDEGSPTPLDPELLAWADLILVMEPAYRRRLSSRFGRHLKRQRIVSLGIPDEYEYMDPRLVERLKRVVPGHLARGGSTGTRRP